MAKEKSATFTTTLNNGDIERLLSLPGWDPLRKRSDLGAALNWDLAVVLMKAKPAYEAYTEAREKTIKGYSIADSDNPAVTKIRPSQRDALESDLKALRKKGKLDVELTPAQKKKLPDNLSPGELEVLMTLYGLENIKDAD